MTAVLDFRIPDAPTTMQRCFSTALRGLAPHLHTVEAEAADVKPLTEWQSDPLGFITGPLGVPERTIRWTLNPGYENHRWDGTEEPLLAVLDALAKWENAGVESATSTGKTFLAACILLWFLASWKDSRVFTFAPKEDQLKLYMWTEVQKLWPRFSALFPLARLTDLTLRMRGGIDDTWGAFGYPVGQQAGNAVTVRAQGMHAEHMLLIYEEAPGIQNATIEAGENTATAPHNLKLAIGNPDHQLDALHLFCFDQFGQPRPNVRAVRISALDHPNVVSGDASIVPGAVSAPSIVSRRSRYGETGRLFQSRVRGISPSEAVEALIKLEWVRKAQQRWLDEADKVVLTGNGRAKKALGVDVANSEGGDLAAVSRWTGAYCREVVEYPCPNSNNFGFRVKLEMDQDVIDPEHVGVDDVGVGAGAVNELKRLDQWVQALGGGDKWEPQPGEDEQYNNLRSQMAWTLREDLRLDNIAIPPDDDLAMQLIMPQWKTMNSKIVVESKEDIKKRVVGGRSPNKFDALMYGNWVRDRTVLFSRLPKRTPTTLERLQKEMQELDRREQREREYRRNGGSRFGKTLRQG